MNITIGSIVRPKEDMLHALRTGAAVYPSAIVVNMFPFVLVSECKTVIWTERKENEFFCIDGYIDDDKLWPYQDKYFRSLDDEEYYAVRGVKRELEKSREPGMLPRQVYQMCVHGALIVGSQAKRMMGEDIQPADWDLLCPNELWQTVALIIPNTAVMNKFGGWRFFTDEGEEVDVWPDNLQTYLTNCKSRHGGPTYAVDFINNKYYCSGILPDYQQEQESGSDMLSRFRIMNQQD